MAETIGIPHDILDQRDPIARPFAGSILVHAAVVGLLFFGWYWANRPRQMLGEPHPAGNAAYAVSPVHSIPIPQRLAPQNPVANDTQSTVPTLPLKQEVQVKLPDKLAFEIPEKKKRQAERPHPKQQ